MAFKRSPVRSRLPPPNRRFFPFFWEIAAFFHVFFGGFLLIFWGTEFYMSCKKCQIRCQKFRSKIRSFCTGKTRSVPIGIARNTVNFFGGGKPAGKSFFGGAARCNAAAKYFFQKLGLDKTKKCAIIIYIMKKCGGGV